MTRVGRHNQNYLPKCRHFYTTLATTHFNESNIRIRVSLVNVCAFIQFWAFPFVYDRPVGRSVVQCKELVVWWLPVTVGFL